MSAMVTAEPPPLELLHAILRERHGDLVARVSDVQMEPIASGGYSGNPLYRVRVSRAGGSPAAASRPATFVLKRWLPGGHGERLLGVDRPLEALAWARGILQPGSLPAGVVVPFLGVRLDPSGDAAWILMKDVSASLDAYSRERPLPRPRPWSGSSSPWTGWRGCTPGGSIPRGRRRCGATPALSRWSDSPGAKRQATPRCSADGRRLGSPPAAR